MSLLVGFPNSFDFDYWVLTISEKSCFDLLCHFFCRGVGTISSLFLISMSLFFVDSGKFGRDYSCLTISGKNGFDVFMIVLQNYFIEKTRKVDEHLRKQSLTHVL